jgi:hypothetical protein
MSSVLVWCSGSWEGLGLVATIAHHLAQQKNVEESRLLNLIITIVQRLVRGLLYLSRCAPSVFLGPGLFPLATQAE